jgi:transcription-repair coupling factor (superfamily II helicase)
MSFSDSFAWQLTQLSTQAHRPLLVITAHNRELTQLSQTIQFFNPSIRVISFPDWETLPYERLSPAAGQVRQRLETLSQLGSYSEGIIITTLTALLQRLAPQDYITAYVFQFSLQGKIDMTQLSAQLACCGYQRVTTVTLPGEFAIRGSLMDIFPLNTKLPFRVHTSMHTVEQLYYFDPTTQKPSTSIDSIHIIPTREFLLSEESVARFRQQGHQALNQRFLDSPINKQLSTTSYVSGIEYYLPLFFEKTNTFIDYLPRHTHWITHLNLSAGLGNSWQHITARYNQLHNDIQWPILSPDRLYQHPEALISQLNAFKLADVAQFPTHELPDLYEARPHDPLHKLKHFLNTLPTKEGTPPTKILFCSTRLSQQEPLLKRLAQIDLIPTATPHWHDFLNTKDPYQISLTPIKKGFWIKSLAILLIPETALYSTTYTSSAEHHEVLSPHPKPEEIFNNLSQLTVNDPVVHIDHGIGRYLGLQQILVNQHISEFIVLAYAEDTKLYVPIQDIRYISRYTGQENPSLHYLSSNQWKKTKQKALTQLKDTAAELLTLYAQRAQAKGDAFKPPNTDYAAFSNAFAFEETADQKTAIAQIVSDLCCEKPMDRLLCGDVGFGKTEVAMRAAFLAIQSDKQVALLAPTTLLVDQHYRNFRERFADWPTHIDWLSRFRTHTDNRLVKQQLTKGTVDIIIGTHTLLSKDVKFKSLGLLIIDEEHHFGVQQKERLKILKAHINVLTLTATPIPRTLQTALSGLRELSLITTPPPGRLPIRNFITAREPTIIREAILRELSRGGQIYFVHNRIASLARVTREIQGLVPEAQIGVAHGQLPEHELEACMEAFYQQKYNILLCTSIIETGLDIPTVNTLIVDQADHFGLAQLHQLRGRVGRSHHQAYAYFLVPDESQITNDAGKRLDALSCLTQLGAGFNLASQDLDIRGAGELLGERQSGTLQGIGFSLYLELLEKTIQAMRTGENLTSLENAPQEPALDLKLPAFIPDTYLPDISLRLQYYKKISKAENTQHLNDIQGELLDRYGILPQEANNLFAITGLKHMAQQLGIAKIEANTQGGWIEFTEKPNINPAQLIQLVQQEPQQFKLAPNPPNAQPHLRFRWEAAVTPHRRIGAVRQILERLE